MRGGSQILQQAGHTSAPPPVLSVCASQLSAVFTCHRRGSLGRETEGASRTELCVLRSWGRRGGVGGQKQGRCSLWARKLPDTPVGSRCRPWQVQGRCAQVRAGVGQRASSTARSGRPGAGWIRTAVHSTGNSVRNRPCALRRPTTLGSKGALLLKANGEAGLFRPRRPQQRCHLLKHLTVFKALSWPRAARRNRAGSQAPTAAKPEGVREEALSPTPSDNQVPVSNETEHIRPKACIDFN